MQGQKKGKKGGQSSSMQGKGWHGDPQGHSQAGSQSSGNKTDNRGNGKQ
jgi:hypothetical protein